MSASLNDQPTAPKNNHWVLKSLAGLVLALAALFFNLMPMIGVESLVATPDAPEIAAAAVLLYALAYGS